MSALRVLRPRQWAHFVPLPAMALTGSTLSADLVASLAAAALVAACCLGFAYGVNAVAERATDRSSAKNPLAGVSRVTLGARAAVALSAALALGVSIALGPRALLACAISLAAGVLYSVGPRLKRLPFVGLATNVAIFAPLAFVTLEEPAPRHFALVFATFCALLVQNQLVHERVDEAEDAAAGALTTARFLGARGTRDAVALTGGLGAIACAVLAPSAIAAAVAGLVLLLATLVGARRQIAARHRLHHRAVSILGGAALFAALLGGLV